MKTRETFVHWFSSYIRLSRADYAFVNNIVHRVTTQQAVTLGQAALLDKIIFKYRKQLQSYDVEVGNVLALPWLRSPTPGKADNDKYQLQIANGYIICSFPYNSTLVQKIRQFRNGSYAPKSHWNRDMRQWETPLSLCNFKRWYQLVVDSGYPFTFCPQVQQLLDTIAYYGTADHWRCRLVQLPSGYWVVNNIAESLLEHLPEFDYEINEKIIDQLTELGICIEPSQLPINIQQRPTLSQLLTKKVVQVAQGSIDHSVFEDIEYYIRNLLGGLCVIESDADELLKSKDVNAYNRLVTSVLREWTTDNQQQVHLLRIRLGIDADLLHYSKIYKKLLLITQ